MLAGRRLIGNDDKLKNPTPQAWGFSFLVSGFWFLVSGFWFLVFTSNQHLQKRCIERNNFSFYFNGI
jgi:hypothetical protein